MDTWPAPSGPLLAPGYECPVRSARPGVAIKLVPGVWLKASIHCMEEYVVVPERRYPSPSAQRRSGEHWKARFGLVTVAILTLGSAAVLFRIAGLGVGAAISPLRGPAQAARPNPTAIANQAPPAAQPTAQPAAAVQPVAAPGAVTPVSPTARPGQKEYTVQGGDTLSAIASRNNSSVDAIVAANNLRSRDVTLNIGQKLIIP